jgi:hypothetical protein
MAARSNTWIDPGSGIEAFKIRASANLVAIGHR